MGKQICRCQSDDYTFEDAKTHGIGDFKPTKTQQHCKNEVDINTIVNRHLKTGSPLPVMNGQLQYGDFSDVKDYQSAQNAVIEAENLFMELPAELRKRFHHSAGEFLEFCSDENNRDEAIRLGLVEIQAPPVEDNNVPQKTEEPKQKDA